MATKDKLLEAVLRDSIPIRSIGGIRCVVTYSVDWLKSRKYIDNLTIADIIIPTTTAEQQTLPGQEVLGSGALHRFPPLGGLSHRFGGLGVLGLTK